MMLSLWSFLFSFLLSTRGTLDKNKTLDGVLYAASNIPGSTVIDVSCLPFFLKRWYLVDLLLLVDTELTGAHVDQEEQTTDNRQDLEEIVLSKVLVGVIVVKLREYQN